MSVVRGLGLHLHFVMPTDRRKIRLSVVTRDEVVALHEDTKHVQSECHVMEEIFH